MYTDFEKWMRRCLPCQQWNPRRFKEQEQYTVPVGHPFAKIHLDVQHLPLHQGIKYLLEGRCYLTGYVEAEAIRKCTSKANILAKLNIQQITTSPYNARANGINESGHISIASSLAKMTDGTGKSWRSLLPAVLFADRTSIRSTTGKTPFRLVHGYDPITPIEMDLLSWRILDWQSIIPLETGDKIKDAQAAHELLKLRIQSMEDRDLEFKDIAMKVGQPRQKMAEWRNAKNKRLLRPKIGEVTIGDLVLVYDNIRSIDMSLSRKLTFRWRGPFRVRGISSKKAYYLCTLDGIQIETPFSPDRIKKLYSINDVLLRDDELPLLTQEPLEEQEVE
ncbi:uncharacterized protein BCR38DRAFT_355580 [Pseudomassariella vexata]|uniref:Integrase catalytic domain-containing protein n=1 Tax=Pseudomassariella vexata TaxID=1141098 RepID=A0A1Y2DBF5_9PEZI|nr:uncharacterized protein BCR38DRAFT_355580 [Pseudomassariella vexata]ORY56599.1 hypothetical protein BCR38DRAFT_355580 [Pseudomassariella vexata]